MLERWRHWLGCVPAATHVACALILLLGAAFSLAAQAPASSAFAPLEGWKTAVLAGDKASLKEFYSFSAAGIRANAQGEDGGSA